MRYGITGDIRDGYGTLWAHGGGFAAATAGTASPMMESSLQAHPIALEHYHSHTEMVMPARSIPNVHLTSVSHHWHTGVLDVFAGVALLTPVTWLVLRDRAKQTVFQRFGL